MRILVTGGAGFIGSNLCRLLRLEGHKVAALDNLSTGLESNVADLRTDPDFALHIGSARDMDPVWGLVDWSDAVVHLAAVVGVHSVLQDPAGTIHTNIRCTENVLQACRLWNTPVLIASSSEVYGKSSKAEFHEDDDLILGPTSISRWSYACSKAMDEWMAFAYHDQYDLPVVVARFFNISGPGQLGRYGMVLPRFVSQAMAGEPLTVYGDGSQERTFTHVYDAVECVSRLMELLVGRSDPALIRGKAINIGTTKPISIYSLAELVNRLVGSDEGIVRIPYEEAYGDKGFQDMSFRCPNVQRLKDALGFVPKLPIKNIIKDMIGRYA